MVLDKSQKVGLISNIVLLGFVFGVIYHYILGAYLNLSNPFNSFLYPPTDAFCDFTQIFPYLKGLNPYREVTLWIVYFPLAYILFLPFTLFKNWLISFLILVFGFLASFSFLNTKSFSCENLSKAQNFKNIFILTLLSYPLLYLIDRGNFDMVLLIILGAFVYAFKNEKYLISSILLAVVNAIKPFSILFLVLFLMKKKYRECFLSAFLTFLLVVGGFLFFKGGFFNQIAIYIKILSAFKYNYGYLYNQNGMGYASSLYMLLKLIFCKSTLVPIVSTQVLLKIYDYFCFIATGITIFFVCKEKTYWKQLTLLICNFLLLPIVTFDYKLIFLYLGIWMFINAKEKSKFDLIYTLLFSLLLIPKNIVILTSLVSPTAAPDFSLSIIINPIIMIVLTGLIIYEQIINKEGRING